MITAIRLAQERGETAEALGRQYGELFAPGWAEDLKPVQFLEVMNRNWQMLAAKTHVLEEGPDKVRARRSHVYERPTFEERFGRMGVSYDDAQAFFRSLSEAIADSRGLAYEETDEGESLTITVKRAE